MKKIIVILAMFSIVTLTGCMSNQEKMSLENRLTALESQTQSNAAKANDAMRTAKSAQVDANTALHIAVKNQQKLK